MKGFWILKVHIFNGLHWILWRWSFYAWMYSMAKTFKWWKSLSFQTIQVARLSQAQKVELNTNTKIWILDLPRKCKTITWEPESQPSACSQIYLKQGVVWKFKLLDCFCSNIFHLLSFFFFLFPPFLCTLNHHHRITNL
jgi:hypothetical protein